MAKRKKILQKAWANFERTENLQCLFLINKVEGDILSLLERLQVIDKAADRLLISTYQEDILWARAQLKNKQSQVVEEAPTEPTKEEEFLDKKEPTTKAQEDLIESGKKYEEI